MRLLFFTFFCAFQLTKLQAQTPVTQDTTIRDFADSGCYPLIPACAAERHPGWNADSVKRCSERQLLAILAQNIRYPEEARQKNIEGSVVVSFVVEPTGRITGLSLMKDIGGGCGPEALRVLQALDSVGLRWQPGLLKGKPVRLRQSLPLRFKLQEVLPYYVAVEGDTIYTRIETAAAFKGGDEALSKFLLNNLEYPAEYADSCKTGLIEMELLVRGNGTVSVASQLDFNNLGLDFQWQAIRLGNQTAGQWQPAGFGGKPVSTLVPVRALFKSAKASCATANARFDKAMVLTNEGLELQDNEKLTEALAKWNEALALHPGNTEILYYRGSALFGQNKREEACADYNAVKAILGITWFEPVRKLVCGW
jgi:TonB family protein